MLRPTGQPNPYSERAARILQHLYILCEQMAGYIVAARRSTDRALLVSRRSRATTASGKTSPLKSGSGTSTSHNPTKFPGCRAAENPTPSRRTASNSRITTMWPSSATARELSPTARNSLFRIKDEVGRELSKATGSSSSAPKAKSTATSLREACDEVALRPLRRQVRPDPASLVRPSLLPSKMSRSLPRQTCARSRTG